jgi:hypothetical protein
LVRSSGEEDPGLGTVEGILAAEGLEQFERLALFLPRAEAADLERLYVELEEQRNGFLGKTLGPALFLRWMRLDPEGGRAFAMKRNRGGMAWWAWGKVDPEAAVAAAQASKEWWKGEEVVRAIGQSDPARAQALLDEHPQWRTEEALTGLAAGLMPTDPAAGATLIAASTESVDHDKLVSAWARRDPEAALAWAQALPDKVFRVEALIVMIDQWAKTDPDRIAATLTALPDGWTKWQLYATHTARLAVVDPAAAMAWAQAAPTEGLRRQASLEAARGLARSDPAGALDILRGLDLSSDEGLPGWRVKGPDGGDHSEVYSSTSGTVAAVAEAAPEATMTFVAGLSEGPETHGLVQSAFSTWMWKDSMAASGWLAGQPAGAVRESAAVELVEHLSQGVEPDFDAALHWANTLSAENQRKHLRSVFGRWRQRDAAAARAALDHPGVPADVRDVLSPLLSKP